MRSTFTRKTIRFDITLGKGAFADGGRTKTIEGLACDVSITKPGLPQKNSASIDIWGLKYEDMGLLTMLAFEPLEAQHNLITVSAGDEGSTPSVAFQGEITTASADFNAAPDVCMRFQAETGSFPRQKVAPPATINGTAPAELLFAQYAAQADYAFCNDGVTTFVCNTWYPGSSIDKMMKLARDIHCELIIDDGQVVIMPAGQARTGSAVFLSKDTGMIGYPTFNQDGISCRCLYNPALVYGGLIEVKSVVPKASGTWRITRLSHSLSAYKPGGGAWESQIDAARL